MKTHQIKTMPLNKMNIATYNPRKQLQENDIEYEKLENSINNFGYVQLIVFNEATGNVVAGNQKAQMFKNKGIENVETIVINEPDLNKEKALNLALNKISGEWDTDKLKDLFDELLTTDIDLALTGFDIPEIDLITIDNIFVDPELDIIQEYKEPERAKVKCPNCGHVDHKERFVKA